MPSVADTGSVSARIVLTDWPVYFSEDPKSPRSVFDSILPYCTYHGRFRPYFSRRFFSIAGGIFFSEV
jgi:hypothetical protein